ncbi:MAG TPA: LuxR C-terminal-related transcriptional regulator [Microbacterium sp.]|nr:LuxR C-terminal-related transcriptional regulator [Microbacterium sp.]
MVVSEALERARSATAARRWGEACELFAEARSHLADGLAPPDLELLATASYLRGQKESAFEALTTAHESYAAGDDTAGAARTAGWMALLLLEVDDLQQSMNWSARGLRLIERLGDGNRAGGQMAQVAAAIGAMIVGDIEDATRRFDAIADVAARSGDRELTALTALGRGRCLTSIGRTVEGLARLDQAMAAAEAGEVSPIAACWFYRVSLNDCHEAFDLERAQRWTAAFEKRCREQPDLVAYSGQCHAYRARLFLLRAEWAEASAAANLAEERLRAGDFTARYLAKYELADLHRLRGELRAADEHYRRAAETGWDPQPGLALLRLAEGEYGLAQLAIRRAVGAASLGGRGRLLPAVVEIELAAGDVAAARRAADGLIALNGSAPTPMLAATSSAADAHVLSAEGDAAAALDAVGRAISAWSALDVPYEIARCRVLRGRILGELAEADDAAAEFEAAREVLVALGARSALAELTAVTGAARTGILTSREAEVLRLVSTGLTNRAIAGRLSLSEKTVARHLSNIFGKLGLSSRSAATAYAYQHGLI